MGQSGWATVGAPPKSGDAPEMPDVVPGMPGSMPGTPADQAAFFGSGSGQPGAVTPETLIAAGVPPEHAQAAAAAYAQAQQMFGGATMNVGDITVENQGSQTLDLRGMEGVRDEMREVMRQHGVDPESGVAMDASSVPGLQEALMKVLARNGVDLSQFGDLAGRPVRRHAQRLLLRRRRLPRRQRLAVDLRVHAVRHPLARPGRASRLSTARSAIAARVRSSRSRGGG